MFLQVEGVSRRSQEVATHYGSFVNVGYEAAIEIYKSKEFTQFSKRSRKGKITSGLDFGIKRLDALRSDFMTEEDRSDP